MSNLLEIKDYLSEEEPNYDYALIYVEDDLSEYGIWNMGVLSDSFMNSSANLTTSGFAKLGGVSARYYDKGMVTSPAQWILDEANMQKVS